MELIIITPELTIEGELKLVNKMLTNGLYRLHLRKPSFTIDEYRDYIKGIKSTYRAKVVIHGHFELYKEFVLGGIHLNEAYRNDATVWEQIKKMRRSKISASFHSWQEIADNEFQYRYIFISPVFDSISKPGYKAAIDLTGAKITKNKLAADHRYCPKIIGLGGVGPEQIKTLYDGGFDGVAMLGAIWENEFPYAVFLEALRKL